MSETATEVPSFAAILHPYLAEDTDEDQLMFLWGRFWGEQEDVAGAFMVKYNLDNPGVLSYKPIIFESSANVQTFDPDESPEYFGQQIPDDPAGDNSIPQATIQMVNQSFKSILSNRETLKTVRKALEEKNREAFKDWAYEFFGNLITKGDITFQIKGQLITESTIETNGQKPEPEQAEETETEEDSDTEEDDRNYRSISIATSPMKGKFPADIEEGEEIFVRATGPIVEKLPDSMVDDRYEDVSIQLEATLLETESDPTLPGDFDGKPEDYWGIKVKFLKEEFGEGFVHKDEQIKLVNPDTETTSSTPWFFEPIFMIGGGLTLLVILGLAYILFG